MMATKKVVFEFPAEAWDGIVLALTQYEWPATIPNPAYDGSDPTVPPMIPNNGDRGEAATQHIQKYVEQRFKQWATQERQAVINQQIDAEVSAIATAVTAATVVSIETE
jgi:hypothetical protein